MNAILVDALNIPNLIPFREIGSRCTNSSAAEQSDCHATEVLGSSYLRMFCENPLLDRKKALEHSKTLAALGPLSERGVRKYIHIWKEKKFLN